MRTIKNVLAGAALALYLAAPAYAIGPFPNQPLYLSSAVSPNVMLLMDDSGSMRHIIWERGYDSNVNYFQDGTIEFWNNDNQWQDLSTEEGTYITKNNMKQGDCTSGFARFRLGGSTTKCIKFPDPVGGGNTWFVQNYVAYVVRAYANDTDLTALSDFPNDYRMNVAKTVAKSVIANNTAMRFGLFSFRGQVGGELEAEVGATQATLNEKVDALTPSTSTPLAEAYYEVTRYFRGLSKASEQTGTYTSPIQYRCQKNFGIVITDGLPTYDTTFPTDDPEDVSDSERTLPDWDGLSPTTNTLTPSPQYSDGYRPWWSGEWNEGYSLYLDDIAKFAYDIDMVTSGNDLAGKSYNDRSFAKQNLLTYTVGFAQNNQMLGDAAEYGRGSYYTASDSGSLATALNSALQSIREQTSSASAIAANSTRIQEDTLIYQARYNSADWTGEVRAFNVEEDGSVGEQAWTTTEAGKIPSAASRNIFSFSGSAGTSFLWANLTTEQRASLYKAADDTEANAMLRLGWLRGGNDGAELGAPYAGVRLRSRNSVLGDIINSDPQFIGEQNNGYNVPNTDTTGEPADSYHAYVTAKATKVPLVIVGANDGMVHAFNGYTGAEVFAYVPSSLFKKRTISPGATPGLLALSESDYGHQFYADGSFGLGDVYSGSAWKTYLAGGLGAGGRGVFALNLTAREQFGASGVLWERTAPDTSTADDDWNDLGYVFGEPTIARIKTSNNDPGTWVAIFGNGYASNTGKAALYIVNATTGTLLKKIVVDDPADASLNNGLSTVTPFLDSNRFVTYVYGGDLQGNLWKFDLTASNSNNWAAQSLFQAKKGTVRQPITSKVRVVSHPNGGRLVVFGTGKYLETIDKTNTAVQSLYGIWDRGLNNDGTVSASTLVQQTITSETDSNGREFRIVSQNTVDWSSKFGWYMDLKLGTSAATGERVVSMPLVNKDRVLFSTFTPLSDPCLSGGESWIFGLNVLTGGRLATTVFDVNGDRVFDYRDQLACGGNNTCDASGFKLNDGSLDSPGAIFGDGFDSLYNSGLGEGGIEQNTAAGSGGKPGRMSWRQIQ